MSHLCIHSSLLYNWDLSHVGSHPKASNVDVSENSLYQRGVDAECGSICSLLTLQRLHLALKLSPLKSTPFVGISSFGTSSELSICLIKFCPPLPSRFIERHGKQAWKPAYRRKFT